MEGGNLSSISPEIYVVVLVELGLERNGQGLSCIPRKLKVASYSLSNIISGG
jgi:hypothetical protein